jgi:hypothetical protein
MGSMDAVPIRNKDQSRRSTAPTRTNHREAATGQPTGRLGRSIREEMTKAVEAQSLLRFLVGTRARLVTHLGCILIWMNTHFGMVILWADASSVMPLSAEVKLDSITGR